MTVPKIDRQVRTNDSVPVLRNLAGDKVSGYSSLMAGAREQALDRMTQEARQMGANTIMNGAPEIMAHGTAVRLS